jgi:hypothetical protein
MPNYMNFVSPDRPKKAGAGTAHPTTCFSATHLEDFEVASLQLLEDLRHCIGLMRSYFFLGVFWRQVLLRVWIVVRRYFSDALSL